MAANNTPPRGNCPNRPGDMRQVGDLDILNASIGGAPAPGAAGPLVLAGQAAQLSLGPGRPPINLNVQGVLQFGVVPISLDNWVPPTPGTPIGDMLDMNLSGISGGLSDVNAPSLNSSAPMSLLGDRDNALNISGNSGLSGIGAPSFNSSGAGSVLQQGPEDAFRTPPRPQVMCGENLNLSNASNRSGLSGVFMPSFNSTFSDSPTNGTPGRMPGNTPQASPNLMQFSPIRSPDLMQFSPTRSPDLMQFSPNVSIQSGGSGFGTPPPPGQNPAALGIRRLEPQGSPQSPALNQMVREAQNYLMNRTSP